MLPRSLVLALSCGALSVLAAPPAPAIRNKAPLTANAFAPLPLTSVKPRGWLLEQLRIQADGLSGHLDEFWPDVGPQSAWLGGAGEGWERGPYYLDGLLPLAYLTGNTKLIAKAQKWVDWTLTHQRPDGAIGPEKNLDWWPNMIMLKVLTQYQEATGDARVIPLMEKYFTYQAAHLDERPLHEWAAYRWQDEVLSVLWLYDRNGDPKLLDLARKLHSQGFDWNAQFANFKYTEKVGKADAKLNTHGVNNTMAMKAAAVWSEVTGAKEDREAAYQMLRMLDRYHLLPNGMPSADEHYAGLNPSQGVELCAVVEAMFSLETEMAILGDASFGDRLEKISYNALPGTMSPDLWSHQYDQQPNQVMCTLSQRDWSSNGPESNLFGLEPNFGCCTANFHQGWPKLAASLWMATPGDGVAAVAYAPSQVTTVVNGGVSTTIEEETDYPFRDRIVLTVKPDRAAAFPLLVRIPAWADGASVAVNGKAQDGIQAGAFLRIQREWRAGDKVELQFPMKVRVLKGYHDSISVERGPLVYALQIGELWRKLKQTGPATDWELYPTTPWNYALEVDMSHPERSFTVEERPVGKQPFSTEGLPVVLKAKGRRLTDWLLVDDSAGPLPASPVVSKQPEETLTLAPYGAARLRITSIPVLAAAR